MPKLKVKPQAISVYPIENWSVKNYGVCLYINTIPKQFDGIISLDVEDNEQDGFVGLGIYDGESCYYWSDLELAKQLTISTFIAHNGKTDLAKLQKWGFDVTEDHLLWDTQLMEHILDSSKHTYGLKALILEHFGKQYPAYSDIVGKETKKQKKPRITLDKQPLELVAEYNACDTYWTYKLYEKQALIKDTDPPGVCNYFDDIEKPCSFIFQRMEERGLSLDLNYLDELKCTLEQQITPLEASIKAELGNINLDSPKQLIGALNAKDIRPMLKGKASTDKRALENWKERPIVSSLLQYSELSTLLSSFVEAYLERGEKVVHPHFNPVGTRTGRPSCSNPNLLQIPKRTDNGKLVRRMFTSRAGMLLGDCDYGQIEPRVLAHISQDPNMCDMFNKGVDFHTFTAEKLRISRDRAKILNLSVGYRATYKSVSQQLKCSWKLAQTEIEKWWSLFPTLYDWQQKLIYESRKSGYCTTLMGRRIKVDELNTPNEWRREGAERQLINNITQGSAAEVMKKAMIDVDKQNISILVQVYDELLFESPEESISSDIEIVIDKMQNAVMLSIPLTVDAKIGKTWGDVA